MTVLGKDIASTLSDSRNTQLEWANLKRNVLCSLIPGEYWNMVWYPSTAVYNEQGWPHIYMGPLPWPILHLPIFFPESSLDQIPLACPLLIPQILSLAGFFVIPQYLRFLNGYKREMKVLTLTSSKFQFPLPGPSLPNPFSGDIAILHGFTMPMKTF